MVLFVKGEGVMELILWIDQNTFASDLLERVFQAKAMPFYTLKSVEDFSYLVDQLDPKVIVLDAETYTKAIEVFHKQFDSSAKMQKIPFILIDPIDGLDFPGQVCGKIERPFDPFLIPQEINRLLNLI
jgi:hypothetical protein